MPHRNRITFIDRKPTESTHHTCDNQALVKRVNGIRDEDNIHTLNDPIDGDIIVPTAYWATKTKMSSSWVRGHPERRKDDPKAWTDDEWANDIADSYANKAWSTRSRPPCSTTAIHFRHHTSLQIHIPGGSISGKVARRLATDINTRRGLQQLQKTLHLDDDTFGTIDWESFGVG